MRDNEADRSKHRVEGLGRANSEPAGGASFVGVASPRLLAAAEAEAAARGCSQTVHFTYAFQARALYEKNGYELVGCVEDFPTGTDVLWYRKRLKDRADRP